MFSPKLLALLAEQGDFPDYQRLAVEVLGIRGAPPALARSLVEQAILATDWRDVWRRVGARAIEEAPRAPGVYIFRDAAGGTLYVGKAANLRQRLRAHFSDRKWRSLPPAMARVASVACERLGSELEALLREAVLIRQLQPVVNVQTAAPALETRAVARSLLRDVILLAPSVESAAAAIIAARVDGATLVRGASRTGAQLDGVARELWRFFDGPSVDTLDRSAPLVFSWLAGRGHRTTRLDPRDSSSADELRLRLEQLLADDDLFVERVVRR